MKNILSATLFAFVLTGICFTVSASAQTCGDLKNRTYIAFNEGKFDDFTNAAGALRLKFNSTGTSATARAFTAYTPEAENGLQQTITFKCNNPSNGLGVFDLTVVKTGSSAGSFLYKIFDRGAKIWVKSNIPNRDTPFWMIEVPAAPIGEQFPKK